MIEWVEHRPGLMSDEKSLLVIIEFSDALKVFVANRNTYRSSGYSVSGFADFDEKGVNFDGYRIRYIAKINYPKKKTLEEKFKEYHLSKVGWLSQDPDVYKGLAEIAKQHYEGEK